MNNLTTSDGTLKKIIMVDKESLKVFIYQKIWKWKAD